MNAGFALTPRRARVLLDVATALVVISVAFALAGLTWRIAGHAGTGAITVPSAGRAPSVSADIAPALALAPFGKTSIDSATRATSLPLRLTGTVAARPVSLSTAFIAVENQPAQTYRIGDSVRGAIIRAILRDRVILDNAGTLEFLAFPDPTLSPEAREAAQQEASAPAPAQPASGALLQRLDATPVDGGYRIGANGPPGLQPGDVIESVNGVALSDPNAAASAMQAAQSAGSAQITVVRGGNRLTLTVPVP